MQAIGLHDLVLATGARKTSLTVEGFSAPLGADNLVLKAHRALEQSAGRELPTAFHLIKNIPPGSGLGGASSDAAATLRAVATLHALRIDRSSIAGSLGSDVAFFLRGGRAHAEGRGERLRPLPQHAEWFAIAWPGIELSTARVYEAWDEVGGESPNQLQRAAAKVEPRLEEFARKLGRGWQMTGSGSAFFLPCPTREEGERAIAKLDCWKSVTFSVGSWE